LGKNSDYKEERKMDATMIQEIFRQLNEQRDEINKLKTENKELLVSLKTGGTTTKFPRQFKAGIIKYPGCFPFPMSLEIEMEGKTKSPFGQSIEESNGSLKFDIDDPTFLTNITASLKKTHGLIEELPDPGIGFFRPLAMDCCNPTSPVEGQPATDYFCDHEWKAYLDAKQWVFTYHWMPSTLFQTDNKLGFRLPIQYEVKKNDTLHMVAKPLRQVAKEGDGYELKYQVHCYKMLPDPKAVIDAMNQAESLQL
jgi:hypothetical protein